MNIITDPMFFEEAANRLGFSSPIIVEKDYWAVWLLNQLFSDPNLANILVFKGGTSLSKGFQAIKRFSEDLDLTIDRNILGITISMEKIALFGSKKRKKFFADLETKVAKFTKSLCQQLNKNFAKSSILKGKIWRIYNNLENPTIIYFEYPQALQNELYPVSSYVKSRIILEFGARGATTPIINRQITSYIETILPNFSSISNNNIRMLDPQRTFWEKATLLYMLTQQPNEKPLKPGMARHYYDLVMLFEHKIGKQAIKNIELLKNVIFQKQLFFKNSWLDYNNVLNSGITLLPNSNRLQEIKSDYKKMYEMFFEEPLDFNNLIQMLAELETTINITLSPTSRQMRRAI